MQPQIPWLAGLSYSVLQPSSYHVISATLSHGVELVLDEEGRKEREQEGDGGEKGKGNCMRNVKVTVLHFRLISLLLVFFIHLRIFNSAISLPV